MATVADLRTRDYAEVAYLLTIDGISTCWVTDHGPGEELLGSGGTTWMGLSEASIGRTESRNVRPGLHIPQGLTMSLDKKSGQLNTSTYTFKITDLVDPGETGSLATLFATEGKDYDILRERIAPGSTALDSTLITSAGTIDPANKHIGIEAIGNARQRRAYAWLPTDTIGPEHTVASLVDNEKLPAIKVSDDPITWIGRRWGLYRIYRDLDSTAGGASDWPLWDAQIDAGGLVAWGRLLDAAEYVGDKTWSIKCAGPESLLKKQVGIGADTGWISVRGLNILTSSENQGRIVFYVGPTVDGTYDTDGRGWNFTLTGSTKEALIDEIDDHIQDAFEGVSTRTGVSNNITGTIGAANSQSFNTKCRLEPNGVLVIQRDVAAGNTEPFRAEIVLHERVWRLLGYDLETQGLTLYLPSEDEYDVYMTRLVPGDRDAPNSGYIAFEFTTHEVGLSGISSDNLNNRTNYGSDRLYRPRFDTLGNFILNSDGRQAIHIHTGNEDPFLTSDPLVPIHEDSALASTACDAARYAVVRGKKAFLDQNLEVQLEDWQTVAKLCWREGGDYGSVLELTEGGVTARFFYLERFVDPRPFGVHGEPLDRDIVAVAGSEKAKVEILPINSLAYFGDHISGLGEPTFSIPPMLMHSTGTSTGWSGAIGGGTPPTYDHGDNAKATSTNRSVHMSQDVLSYDLSLAIPETMVAAPQVWLDEYDGLPGGHEGAFNRSRFAFSGPFSTEEVIESCMRPRGIYMSLHGRTYSPWRLSAVGREVDVTITEDDLYGSPTDLGSVIPKQSTRFSAPIDGVRLSYRHEVTTGTVAFELFERARDGEASERFGGNIESLTDLGAPPLHPSDTWYPDGGSNGLVPWLRDFRDLWKKDRAEFFAQRHFTIRLAVSRPKGQDLYPGTRVRVTNPWVYNPSGSYGITGLTGRVLSATHHTSHTDVEILMFAGQGAGVRLFAPIAKVLYVDGTTIGLESNNWLGHDGTANDIEFFTEPSWSDTGGSAVVRIMEYDGDVCTLSGSSTVVSTDTVNLTVTTNTTISVNQFTDKWLVMDSHANQSGAWPASTFGVVVGSDFNFGGTRGFRYH